MKVRRGKCIFTIIKIKAVSSELTAFIFIIIVNTEIFQFSIYTYFVFLNGDMQVGVNYRIFFTILERREQT